MTDDLDFQESLDRYFEIEAAELLQTIELTLFQLIEEKNIERVHTLMRSAHTIKGSAANCGFKTIETIAHHLEDVFQALYPAELDIDPELGLLLMEGYDCLSDPLNAMLNGIAYDEAATLERTAELFARLQTHLGDFFGRETPLPTAAELGFDVVGSIFTDSVPQDLEVLAEAIATQNVAQVRDSLASLAEFLLELGGSYSLPGIAAISETTAMALQRHPDRVLEIAPIALPIFNKHKQRSSAAIDLLVVKYPQNSMRGWGSTAAHQQQTMPPTGYRWSSRANQMHQQQKFSSPMMSPPANGYRWLTNRQPKSNLRMPTPWQAMLRLPNGYRCSTTTKLRLNLASILTNLLSRVKPLSGCRSSTNQQKQLQTLKLQNGCH
jgi:chemotaxis protein histidine kinase CheA